jgi:hypothetical protein
MTAEAPFSQGFSVHAQSALDSTAYEPLFKNLDEKPAFQKDRF